MAIHSFNILVRFSLVLTGVVFMFRVQAQELSPQLVFETDTLSWWKLDSKANATEGVSWNKATAYLNTEHIRPKAQITVAILDSSFDLEHKGFLSLIWKNTNEIEDNLIDDDANGYIDDSNGWNFLGTKTDGSALGYLTTEYTRILKDFGTKKFDSLASKHKLPYGYDEVKDIYDTSLKESEENVALYKSIEPK